MLELLVVTLSALYWLPFMVAAARRHHRFAAISVANGLLGWTLVGWLLVLSWALLSPRGPVEPARRGLVLVQG